MIVIEAPFAQFSNLKGPVPIGFSLLVSADFRSHDNRVAPTHIVEERALRVLERHFQSGGIDSVNRVYCCKQALLRIGRVFGARPVERELHVIGVEVAAVVEFHARVELERIGFAVIGDRPAFGERGEHLALGTDPRQTFEDVSINNFVDGRGCPGGRVEVWRFEHHAQHQICSRSECRRARCQRERRCCENGFPAH